MLSKLAICIVLIFVGIAAIFSLLLFCKEKDPAWLCSGILFTEFIRNTTK